MIPRKRLHLILYILRILYVSGDGDPGTEGSLLTSTISSASDWSVDENIILEDASPGERSMLKKELLEDTRSEAEQFYKSHDMDENYKRETENFFNSIYSSSSEIKQSDSSSEESLDESTLATSLLPSIENFGIIEKLTDRVTIKWDVSNNEPNSKVNVTWTFGDKQTNSTELAADSSNYTIVNLEPCVNYTICVSANWTKDYFCDVAETTEIKPGKPKNLKAVSSDKLALKITWDPPDTGKFCVSSYKVQIDSQTHENRQILKNITNETSVVMSPLHACTAYHVLVTTFNHQNDSGDFAVVISELTPTAESEPPRMKEDADSTEIGKSTVTLKWWVPRENNNCTMKKIITECIHVNTTGYGFSVKDQTAEDPITDPDKIVSNVEDLNPFSLYQCRALIVNDKGNSSWSSFVFVKTKEDVPGKVASFAMLDYSKMTLTWKPPSYMPGTLLSYEIILSWKPDYKVPKNCSLDRNVKFSVEPTLTEYPILQYKYGKSKYLAYIRANGTAGVGALFSITFETGPSVPDKVTDLQLLVDNNEDDPNVLDTILKWSLPCNTGGTLKAFEVGYNGFRMGYANHSKTIVVNDFPQNYSDNEVFSYNFGELKPEYNYSYIVSAVINETNDPGEKAYLEAEYPAGIPVQPNEKYTAAIAIHPDKAQRTTSTATVLLPLFGNENGTIVSYAIMVAEAHYNYPVSTRFDLEKNTWPNVSSWEESMRKDFKIPYQATPQRWNGSADYIVIYGSMKFLKYVVGEDNLCKDFAVGGNDRSYCNGPLKPNTYYHVRMRAYTTGGYADSTYFTIKTNAELNVVLVTSIVSGILFLGILTTLMLLVRKYSPRLLLQRVLQADITGSPVPSPFTRRKFLSHCQQLADNPGKLSNEFQLLQTLSVDLQMPTNAACLQANRKKNRYSDILPYDFSRVKLDIIDNDPNTDYINASFIRGYSGEEEYIACQGPKEETTYDFWRMIDQYNVSIILMLTGLVEKGKEKCHQYYPTIRETFNYEKMSIRCTSELHYRTFTQRTLVLQKDEKKRNIIHLHYRDWPDHDVPEDFEAMINFCQIIRKQIVELKGLVVIHCSAGIGRTGTLIATDILLQHIRDNRKLDVFGTVYRLRRHRLNMVQRESQYAFIYNCVRQVLKNPYFLKTYKPPPIDTVYSNHLKKKKDRSDSNSDLSGSIDTLNRKNSLSISMDSLQPLCQSSPQATPKSGINVLLSGLRFSKSTSAIDTKANHNRIVGRFNSEGYMLCESIKDSCSNTSKETAEDFRDSDDSLNEHSEPILKSSSSHTLNYSSSCLSNGSIKDTSL